ncbi:MAG: hypothetical protein L0Y72_06770 [Gemmataceae bacterium]|nr:hypothetical protein [Gemmataceae bacterium]MCI0738727.1 hypothetical protein [Gemmataceae bacterium]
MFHRLRSTWPVVVVALFASAVRSQEALPPREVKVLPIFFVPKGESKPTEDQAKQLIKHLEWSQARYGELLPNQATFKIAQTEPRVYQSGRELAFFRNLPKGGKLDFATSVVGELLDDLKYTRYNCPYVLLCVMMNPKDDFPVGGGRPLNGGYNTGGGLVVLSSFALDRIPNFQSTLQHELGHSFGLPHVDVNGYDMKKSDSFMSYNQGHHTNGFKPSSTPGRMIPEDLRGLAFNQRVFPGLRFDPKKDAPQGYTLAEAVPLGPMKIEGQPNGVRVTTKSGEDFGSKVANIVQVNGRIKPSAKTGKVTFDASKMWQSAKSTRGWVAVEVAFPYDVDLTRVTIHSQHSGQHHAAHAARISVQDANGKFTPVANVKLKSADDTASLPLKQGRAVKGQVWTFEFQTGPSGSVTLRGLRFFSGDAELFPPLVPSQP